ncbi:ABC transporter ATP-binding protein [Alkalihalobacillus sp. AL-G]|uniref:ABC transporter ATP-binding protein n=1 Tax=Alkalihalobacillus sp. AL-G TaxID=2926399 RepID=UPI00272CC3EA|nr:dipeptide ABC transporter ATP-binding protein [Alkalihalobacillus sp. AL-G]WLD94403.1 dipeptide ABC transporter ATP-binding protein [Alkalihalobacillus sp. AL-G]
MNPLLELKEVKTYFPIKKGLFSKSTNYVKAVDGVDLTVHAGETLGIVGESGCGKSTLGKTLLRLVDPIDGEIIFNGKNITQLNKNQMRPIRQDMQIIFQDPYASLSPRMTIGEIIEEPMIIHRLHNSKERKHRVNDLLEIVGLSKFQQDRYPHEFSGGQRQRIGIARALAINPKLIVADEAVSALDVSIQSQILNLLIDLQKEFNLTYLFISHDLSVVKHISDRVAVMYLGKIVEITEKDKVFNNPLHPYTKSLLSAIPVPNPLAKRERIVLKGDLPSPSNPPKGCTFHTRCPMKMASCETLPPKLQEVEPGHYVSCHLYNEFANEK